jgi:predicted RND superfamily exporter protein
MLSTLFSTFSFFKNIANIRAAAAATYQVVVKLIAVLKVVQEQLAGTPVDNDVEKYLPTVLNSLNNIKTLAEKYSPILGITLTVPVSPATAQSATVPTAHEQLTTANTALTAHVS